jgi:hypothetical protein
MHVQSDLAILLTVSESSKSEPAPEEALLDAFESDSNFAAEAIQLLGHFLAPGLIPPPAVALALESEADDSDAKEITDYAATLTNLPNMDTLTCRCLFFCAAHITGTLKFVKISQRCLHY